MKEKSIGDDNAINNWLNLIKANDETALKQLYVHNFEKVRIYILSNSGNEADVKDIFQEAFVAFWRNVQMDKFTAINQGAIDKYLMSIAKYKWIDHLRKQKKMSITDLHNKDLAEEFPSAFNEVDEEFYNKIKVQFFKMDHPCKELLYKFYFKKEKLKQIAEYFSWKETTTKNNKYRCLQKLRKAVLNNL